MSEAQDKNKDLPENNKFANRLGLFMAFAFYIIAVIMVIINTSGGSVIDPDEKRIIIGHWQLEDGFRHGLDQVIKDYEKMKAAQGQKVKVIQSTVPGRGYQQWFVTQMISGDPTDIIQLRCSSQMKAQYMVPLSDYIGAPNPYNKGTPLEGIPWKDTFVDGMNSSLDPVYADYFGIGSFFHVMRVYVNKDLLKKATGSDKMPQTFDEWMDTCRKMREYGEKEQTPIIPIGMTGVGKGMLLGLFIQYFSQLNGHINDFGSVFRNWDADSIFSLMADGKLDWRRLLAAVELIKEAGQNFGDGFITADQEQVKFLFFAGKVGFYFQGTWDAWSMIKNSPFEVEVITIPIIGSTNRYSCHFTGEISEQGVGVGGQFGIPKAGKNFDLSLDFLRYMTSYNVNQKMMMEHCKWPPAVIKAKYEGIMKKFEPIAGDARKTIYPPFFVTARSQTKMAEILEYIIVKQLPDSQDYFLRQFKTELIPMMLNELEDAKDDAERRYFDIEAQRNCSAIGLMAPEISKKQRNSLELRELMSFENLIIRFRGDYLLDEKLIALDKLEKQNINIQSVNEEVK
ncbi:MAG: extracellular solute-binding protein [Victivallales bacterium]|nr:extracellular solute-binding protein [Victivallales bacterium]